jgi:diaminopimelate epimerase
MQLSFYKLQAYGSDFVLLSAMGQDPPPEEDKSSLAKTILDRRTGVGGKGLVLVYPGEGRSLRLHYYNKQGNSEAPPPDALLCVSRYCFDSGFLANDHLHLHSHVHENDKEIQIRIIDSNNFRVSLGLLSSFKDEDPIVENPEGEYNRTLSVDGRSLVITPIFAGEQFYIHFSTQPQKNKKKFFPLLYRSSTDLKGDTPFPLFASVYARDEIFLPQHFVKDRPDVLSACAAAVSAAVVNGFSDREVVCYWGPENMYVEWAHHNNALYITGSAGYTFTGEYYFGNEEIEHGPAI